MQTGIINLVPQTPERLRALIEGPEVFERRFGIRVADGVRDFLVGPEVSAEFLARLNGATASDPWKDGFAIVHVADNVIIGLCSFVGPPSTDGTVEIAYGIVPEYQSRGFASTAAQTLIAYAFASGQVRTIQAHTLPEHSASTSVLLKCGFTRIGEVTHSEDGLVWRWEMQDKV
jgi:RimJ/RimL family protein N-acetyltransferase